MRRLDLTEEQLLGPGGLIVDKDGDGFPETWNGWIALPRKGPAQLYAAAAEIAVRAGQDLVALDGPATCFQDELGGQLQPEIRSRRSGSPRAGFSGAGRPVDGARSGYLPLFEADPVKIVGLARSACRGAAALRQAPHDASVDNPAAGTGSLQDAPGLNDFWSSGFLRGAATVGRADAFFPVGHRLAIWVPDGEMSGETGQALVEFAARYGLESAGLEYPVVFVGQETIPTGRPVVRVTGDGSGSGVTEEPGDAAGASHRARVVEQGVVETDAAGLRWLAELPTPSDPVTWAPETPALRQDGPLVAEGHSDWEWEVDEIRALFEREVLPRVAMAAGKGNGRVEAEAEVKVQVEVEVEARVSESPAIRRDLEERWRKALLDAGAPEGGVRVKVRSAYKQGLSWVIEEVVPAVRGFAGRAGAVEISFWGFEAPEGEKWLELATRWLQELYPADEILAEALGLPWDKVRFVRSDAGPTYQVTVRSKEEDPPGSGRGEVLYQDSFEATASERFYLEATPEAGKVHPPTGLLRWTVKAATKDVTHEVGPHNARRAGGGGQWSGEVRVVTDLERFWDYFQGVILPEATRYALEDGRTQPFFRRLDIHVWLSEPDDELGVRQERLSPLEALHEDVYFVALDHFAHLGRKATGTPYRSPGLIIPWIHRDDGRGPRCQFTLWGWGGQGDQGDRSSADAAPSQPEGANERPPGSQRPGPAAAGTDQGLARMDQLIGRERLDEALRALGERPGVRIHRAGWSFLGEPSYIVEVCLPASGRISRPKLSLLKPTYVLVARHHANEVSSTNSALKLAELLTSEDERYSRYLRGVNLVIIPFENVDGAALHYDLQREHPTWKLHAGRFNAAGQDLAAEYWKDGSAFGESAVLPRVWKAWLPDMMGDDHGVPSHEWEQPFSGYVCPWFSSFWLPRAHFYGIMSYLDGPEYLAHRALAEEARRRVAAAVGGDREIAELNRVWRDRYEKYGATWLPDRFPVKAEDFYQGVLFHWTGIKPAENARNLAARHPEVTALSWVAEVNDETAQGDYLELCARAHLLADLAVLDVMVAAVRTLAKAYTVWVEPAEGAEKGEFTRQGAGGVQDAGAEQGGGGGQGVGRVERVWKRPRPLRLV